MLIQKQIVWKTMFYFNYQLEEKYSEIQNYKSIEKPDIHQYDAKPIICVLLYNRDISCYVFLYSSSAWLILTHTNK